MRENGKKGITLVALVITIIILLILVGITLITITDKGNIVEKAVKAKEKTINAEILEKLKMTKAEIILEKNGETYTLEEYLSKLKNNSVIEEKNINRINDLEAEISINNKKYTIIKTDKNIEISISGEENNEIPPVTTKSYILSIKAEEGGSVSGDNGEIIPGTQCSVIAQENTGYKFLGWYNDDEKVSDDTEFSFTMPSNNYSLIAKYEIIKYTITYYADGGSGSMSAQTKNHGTTLNISNNEFTAPSGYTFYGWATSPGSSTLSYSANESYSTNANLNLYAIWKCSGTGYNCSTGSTSTCNVGREYSCDGTSDRADIPYCSPCGVILANCTRGHSQNGWKCSYCGRTDRIYCYHSPCSHGYSYSHTVYKDCSHGYSWSHTVYNYCSHGYSSAHSYCVHDKTSTHYK